MTEKMWFGRYIGNDFDVILRQKKKWSFRIDHAAPENKAGMLEIKHRYKQ